jgi:transcriptional regulator with PAS, ATPase and Fis domain
VPIESLSAIPSDLFGSELFSYDRGAFTEAPAEGKLSKFELANPWDHFFDENSDLPIEMESKSLRAAEENNFEPVGGSTFNATTYSSGQVAKRYVSI